MAVSSVLKEVFQVLSQDRGQRRFLGQRLHRRREWRRNPLWRHGETRRHNRTSEPPPPPPSILPLSSPSLLLTGRRLGKKRIEV